MQHISHELDQSRVVNSFVSSNHGHFICYIRSHVYCCRCLRRRCWFFLFFFFSLIPSRFIHLVMSKADDVSLLIIFIVQQQSFIIFLYPFSIQSFASRFFSILCFFVDVVVVLESSATAEKPETHEIQFRLQINITQTQMHEYLSVRIFATNNHHHGRIGFWYCCCFTFVFVWCGWSWSWLKS